MLIHIAVCVTQNNYAERAKPEEEEKEEEGKKKEKEEKEVTQCVIPYI